MNNADAHEQYAAGNTIISRMKNFILGTEDYDDDAPVDEGRHDDSDARTSAPIVQPARRHIAALRLDQARQSHVTVRRSVHGFEDARRAADGLKAGQQQIVNLEQTPADMAQRIIDFLNGATHAIDGSVEKIGEQVYLFTPCSVTIETDDKSAVGSRPSFLDRQ